MEDNEQETFEAIKQAFIDEGWKEPPTIKSPCDICGKESSVIVLMPKSEPNKQLCYIHYEVPR